LERTGAIEVGNLSLLLPLNLVVSWLRAQSLHWCFEVVCQSKNTQKMVCWDSGFSFVEEWESAQKVVGGAVASGDRRGAGK
jgi:hypothetical protein